MRNVRAVMQRIEDARLMVDLAARAQLDSDFETLMHVAIYELNDIRLAILGAIEAHASTEVVK